MELNIGNCPLCGKLFSKVFRDICPACVEKVEEQYKLCSEYLREYRNATIYELSESTGVSINQITKFIREGRISLADNPNLGYPCSSCGDLIRKGLMCDSCQLKLRKDISNVRDDDKLKRERLREEMKKSGFMIKENEKN